MEPPSQADYLIGWICILPEEYLAAKAVLDQQYDFSGIARGRNDRTSYTLGRMGQHPVVINQPPSSLYGEIHASAIAHSMKSTFARIRFVLLVGIGGGVPENGHDIRLGDVVLGEKVIPYASGKSTIFGFEITGRTTYPPQTLSVALTGLEERIRFNGLNISRAIERIQIKDSDGQNIYARPQDILYKRGFAHKGPGCDCLRYEKQRFADMVSRPPRVGDLVKIHKGNIGSADAVVKSTDVRDDLATRENLICFEMEAAGVMSTTPCLPVRGISDYSDSHKNDSWHPYAALAAAVCAKEILGTMTVSDVMRSPLDLDDRDIAEYVKDATREFARYGDDIKAVRRKLDTLMERHDLIEEKLGPELEKLKDQSRKDLQIVSNKVKQYQDLQEELKKSLNDVQVQISDHISMTSTQDYVTREEWFALQAQVAQNSSRVERLSTVTHGALGTTAELLGEIQVQGKLNSDELRWVQKGLKYAQQYSGHMSGYFRPKSDEIAKDGSSKPSLPDSKSTRPSSKSKLKDFLHIGSKGKTSENLDSKDHGCSQGQPIIANYREDKQAIPAGLETCDPISDCPTGSTLSIGTHESGFKSQASSSSRTPSIFSNPAKVDTERELQWPQNMNPQQPSDPYGHPAILDSNRPIRPRSHILRNQTGEERNESPSVSDFNIARSQNPALSEFSSHSFDTVQTSFRVGHSSKDRHEKSPGPLVHPSGTNEDSDLDNSELPLSDKIKLFGQRHRLS